MSEKDLIDRIRKHGLESFGIYYGKYRGTVIKNDDPKNLGRLKIKCPIIYGDELHDYWAWPCGAVSGLGHGIFWIPSPGDPVYITCEQGDPRFPLWEYGWYVQDNAVTGAINQIPGAKPKVKVFLTPGGHRIELNDETVDNFIDIKHTSGFHIKLYSDGIYLGKDNKNLGKFLTDLFNLFSATTVATLGGPMPFNNLVDYEALKAEIAEFLKTS